MSGAMGHDDLIALVEEARRAPSVHNIQPARWALAGAGSLALYADPIRRLPVADPTGHDVRVSLGAACEGMVIALARRGYVAGEVELRPDAGSTAAAEAYGPPAALISFECGSLPDPLAAAVFQRATYRGTFLRTEPSALDRLTRKLETSGHVVIRDRTRIREMAALADCSSDEFLLDQGYWRETWQWLRLSKSDPRWDRDGLNAESLALNSIERILGRVLMAPPAFESMRRLGLAHALTSEGSKIESAGALVLFTAPTNEDPFDIGRSFYRSWLEATACSLALCPISVLADSKRANAEICRLFPLPAARRLVNVFRLGAAPTGFPARLTPRLPAEELVIDRR